MLGSVCIQKTDTYSDIVLAENDLKTFTDPQELCDAANNYEADAIRRWFFFCKGMDSFADSPIVLQQYGTLLSNFKSH